MPRSKNFDYDLVIIGGGSAGIVAGNVAGALGARVALVEKERIGGECLWTGCVPSKALLHAADVAHTLRTAQTHGLKNAPSLTRSNCDGAFAFVREKIESVRENDATEQMLRDFGVELFFGQARFVGPHLLRTTRGDLRAQHFLLAMGSSPIVPDMDGLSETGFVTNRTLFDRNQIPNSLIAIGGGYIACETGQALTRLGASVTIVDRSERLLKRDDAELAQKLTDVLRDEGVNILLNTRVNGVRKSAGQKIVCLDNGREIAADEILISVGRRANTDNLNVGEVGVVLDPPGNVVVNARGRTSARHIYACGDVTGRFQFSHVAEHEAKIVVRNILFPGGQTIPYDVVPWSTFTDPELAHVGLTEAEAREKWGDNVEVLRHEFRQDDRAIVEGKTTGLVKVVTTGLSGTVVGAHILGPGAGDLIHEWVLAMRHRLPVRAIADLIHVYPTASVSSQRAAQRWYAGVMGRPVVQSALGWFGLTPRDAGNL